MTCQLIEFQILRHNKKQRQQGGTIASMINCQRMPTNLTLQDTYKSANSGSCFNACRRSAGAPAVCTNHSSPRLPRGDICQGPTSYWEGVQRWQDPGQAAGEPWPENSSSWAAVRSQSSPPAVDRPLQLLLIKTERFPTQSGTSHQFHELLK